MRGLLVIAALVLVAGRSAHGRELVPDVSPGIVELRYDFAGTDLLLFGAIGGENRQDEQLDIVITLTGPRETILVRRKARVAGIWVNVDSVRVADAPGFYALAATRGLDAIVDESFLQEAGLGLAHLPLRVLDVPDAAERAAFRAGLTRNMAAVDLYQQREGGVRLLERRLFRTDIRLPSTVPAGVFLAEIRLFVDGRLTAERTLDIHVDKTGFERTVYLLATRAPLLYGVTAVFIALLSGWIAGMIAARR